MGARFFRAAAYLFARNRRARLYYGNVYGAARRLNSGSLPTRIFSPPRYSISKYAPDGAQPVDRAKNKARARKIKAETINAAGKTLAGRYMQYFSRAAEELDLGTRGSEYSELLLLLLPCLRDALPQKFPNVASISSRYQLSFPLSLSLSRMGSSLAPPLDRSDH